MDPAGLHCIIVCIAAHTDMRSKVGLISACQVATSTEKIQETENQLFDLA